MARRQPTASDSNQDFNATYARNLASEGADLARKGRESGNLELEQFGNQMMNTALDHIEAQSS